MTRQITSEDVLKTADLSGLSLSEKEVKYYLDVFNQTLDYINTINELNTKSVDETYRVTDSTNVFQSIKIVKSLPVKDVLSNASDEVDGLFATKAVFDR